MRNTMFLLLIAGSVELTARGDHGSSISLKVTVNSQQKASPGLPTVVRPDGQGQYIDGQNGVCASIASTGVLTIAFDCQNVSVPRWLNFTNPPMYLAPPSSPPLPGAPTCSASLIESTFTSTLTGPPPYTNRIGAGAASGGTPFQSMTVDSSGRTPYDVQVFIATQLPTTSGTTNAFRLDYNYSAVFADGANASPAQVWRLSETKWVVESAPSSSMYLRNSSNAAMLVEESTSKNSSFTTECGFYQVPFSLTLDAQ